MCYVQRTRHVPKRKKHVGTRSINKRQSRIGKDHWRQLLFDFVKGDLCKFILCIIPSITHREIGTNRISIKLFYCQIVAPQLFHVGVSRLHHGRTRVARIARVRVHVDKSRRLSASPEHRERQEKDRHCDHDKGRQFFAGGFLVARRKSEMEQRANVLWSYIHVAST